MQKLDLRANEFNLKAKITGCFNFVGFFYKKKYSENFDDTTYEPGLIHPKFKLCDTQNKKMLKFYFI